MFLGGNGVVVGVFGVGEFDVGRILIDGDIRFLHHTHIHTHIHT